LLVFPRTIREEQIMDPSSQSSPPSGGGDGGIQRALDRGSAAAHDGIDQAASVARPAVDRLAAAAHQTVDRASSAANSAAQGVGEKAQQLRIAQDRLVENVRANPLTALSIAFAVGFLLSRLTASR
jgi:ElaB/YqjD/DUF883 family membrane-anchored ribosome-binding protein